MPDKFSLYCRTAFFYLGYIVALLPHATLCVLFGWMLPIKPRYKYIVQWNRFAIWWLGVTCNIHYRITGLEHIPDKPFVLLSNHQSPWETIFLYYYFQPLCATLKRELLSLPFFGWALKMLNPIAIDRTRPRSARLTVLTEGKLRLESGISVLIFPEGTRVKPGQDKKFSNGGAELAVRSDAVILPVAHNAGLFWPAKKLLKYPGTVEVVIGPALDARGRDPRELTLEVHNWIRQAISYQ